MEHTPVTTSINSLAAGAASGQMPGLSAARGTAGSLEQLASLVGSVPVASKQDTPTLARQGLVCGPFNLLAGFDTGRELVDLGEITRVPNSPDWFVGLTNVQGEIVPVFDVAVYFGHEDGTPLGRTTYQLLLTTQTDTVAFLVNRLPEYFRLDPAALAPPTAVQRAVLAPRVAQVVQNVLMHKKQMWLEIDFGLLFEKLEEQLAA